MKSIIKWFAASFDNSTSGSSARKWTAFALMVCIAYIHLKFVNNANAIDALIIDLIGVGFFLGLITVSQLVELRNGSVVKTTQETTVIKTEEQTTTT